MQMGGNISTMSNNPDYTLVTENDQYDTPITDNTSSNNVVNDNIHPLYELLQDKSEPESIAILQTFCGTYEIGSDESGQMMYESVDQMQFFAPVMQYFSLYCGKGFNNAVKWIIDNFLPLNVSYNNNFCYFECISQEGVIINENIINMIVSHDSFGISIKILESFINNNKRYIAKDKLYTANVSKPLEPFRYTLLTYLNDNKISDFDNLVECLKKQIIHSHPVISKNIYDNNIIDTDTIIETENLESSDTVTDDNIIYTMTTPITESDILRVINYNTNIRLRK